MPSGSEIDVSDVSDALRRTEQQNGRIEVLEKQMGELSQLLKSVVSVVGRQTGNVEESPASVAAPGGSGAGAGTHPPDAASRTVGGTGRTQGQNMSSVGVGSTSVFALGLNSFTNSKNRTTHCRYRRLCLVR